MKTQNAKFELSPNQVQNLENKGVKFTKVQSNTTKGELIFNFIYLISPLIAGIIYFINL